MFGFNLDSIYLAMFFAAAVVSLIWFYSKKRRYRLATNADKAMWRMQTMSICLGAALYFCAAFLPLESYHPEIYPDDTQEQKIQKLIDNDREMTERLAKFKNVAYFLFFGVGFYLMMLGDNVGKIQKTRNEELLRNDPAAKNPLDL